MIYVLHVALVEMELNGVNKALISFLCQLLQSQFPIV